MGPAEVHELASLEGLASAQPDLLVVHVMLPHLGPSSLAALAHCSKACMAVATHDDYWRPAFEGVPAWRLQPVPVTGRELATRFEANSAEHCAVSQLSVKQLKAELRGRGVPFVGFFEKDEFIRALVLARAPDLPGTAEGRLAGRWQQVFRGARAAEALRATHVLLRPMRGPVARHFIGNNAGWEGGWTTRHMEVREPMPALSFCCTPFCVRPRRSTTV